MSMRIGGDVVAEALVALGATSVVGVPGQHALGLYDALRRSPLRYLGARLESNAAFMADGIARVTKLPAPLLLSTGPGALMALPALMESWASSVPVVVIAAQVPVAGLGGGRHGYLHELSEQSAAFSQVVKHRFTVRSAAQIPTAIADAWRIAMTAPQGPTLVEVPQDILLQQVGEDLPTVTSMQVDVRTPEAPDAMLELAARVLSGAKRPIVLAGGGAARASASNALIAVAEALDAPIFSTFSGRNAVPAHPLDAGSWLEDVATTEYLESADVLLVVGSGLGELSSNYRTFAPRGSVIQIDADLGVINANHGGIGVHSDARTALARIASLLDAVSDPARRAARLDEVAEVRRRVLARIGAQDLGAELELLQAVRDAVPDDTETYWDMTMLAYWAWSAWQRRDGQFCSAQGAGGLGYALPAAIGGAFAAARRTLAVSGDGGAMYGIAELAAAVQSEAPVTWLIVDDGGYGILESYMQDAFGAATATELVVPDFIELAGAFGVPAFRTDRHGLRDTLARAFSTEETNGSTGPNVVVLTTQVRLFAPTHLDRAPQ